MYRRFKSLGSNHRTAVVSIITSLVWLLFGSSVSILSPTNGDLGFLFGTLSAFLILLGPLFYVRIKKIKAKNAKPLLVEPSPWLMTPLSFLVTGAFYFFCLIVTAIISVAALDAIDAETFLSNSIMSFLLFFGLFGPLCTYGVYTLTHYKRIIQYGTPEWKKAKAKQKAAKNG